MKKKTLIIALALVLVLVAAYFGYNALSSKYEPGLPSAAETTAQPEEPEKPAETAAAEKPAPPEEPEETAAPEIQPESEAAAEVNTAPDFTMLDKDGNAVMLSDYFGKPVIINFWATWCGPCRSELPYFNEAWKECGDRIEFMMVNLTDGTSDTVEGVKDFIAGEGYDFPVYFDVDFEGANAYEIYAIPLTVLIDENGNVLESHVGAMSESVLYAYLDMLGR